VSMRTRLRLPACCSLAVVPAGNSSRLAFIGHSQGTTQTFAALASRAELRRQLSFAAMLAPAVHMRHIRSYPLQVLAAMDADRVRGRQRQRGRQLWLSACKRAGRAVPHAAPAIPCSLVGPAAQQNRMINCPTKVSVQLLSIQVFNLLG